MQGMSDIMALYAEGASSLCVNGSVDMLGRLAGISASKYTGYPPYDDAPKEGEFDWEGFTRNLAIGLGVVAVCAIGAAISIATLGAGSILAGAFIGAGIGALSTTAMKAGEEISNDIVQAKIPRGYDEIEKKLDSILIAHYELGIIFEIDVYKRQIIQKNI